MNNLLKILAVAAAFGLTPAAGLAQETLPAQPKQALPAEPKMPAAADAISARSQADPAQPQDASAPDADGAAATPAAEAAAPLVSSNRPVEGIGQPDGRMGLQDQFTPIGEEAAWFHDVILMPVITLISLFVLALMAWVAIRYRRAANPVPSRTTHNTLIEVIWTLVPVIILVVIAVPSIKLLANQYDPPKADLTVKVMGNQWYWTYQYPDHGDFEIVSNMLSDEDAKARGEPRLLGVDERMVVPAGAVVKLIVTSNDVIHAFAVPAFWSKIDAVPGRLNETWFKVDRPGVYYGQCSELCGARHAYMPIAVDVVPPAEFAAWVASKGGTMPGAAPAPTAGETGGAPATVGAAEASEAVPAPTAVSNVAAAGETVDQAATANPRVSE